MPIIYQNNVVPWKKVGLPATIADSYGLQFLLQSFEKPHAIGTDEFSLFTTLEGNQICAITTAGNILVVEQYKQGADCITQEVPGGTAESAEDHKKTVARELLEETGYVAATIIQTGSFWMHTRKSPSRVNTFLAADCQRVEEPEYNINEVITVIEYSPAELLELIRKGDFNDIQSLAAVFMAILYGYVQLPLPEKA